jgi:hypothetical protein
MQSIFELKEQAVTAAGVRLPTAQRTSGALEYTRREVEGATYGARVLRHNVFDLPHRPTKVDGVLRISLVANADSRCSEIERGIGWKGARLTAALVFYDLRNGAALTERSVIFQGICNPPDEILEATFRITATNRMNLQRLLLPQVRIQRRCPWEFPSDELRREEAVDGGTSGKYSRYAGIRRGRPENGRPTATMHLPCADMHGRLRSRGMFHNFGGIELVPPAISVRTYGDRAHTRRRSW